MANRNPQTLIRVGDVAALLSVGKRKVWSMSSSGELPAPIHLSKRSVRWRLADVEAFIDGKAEEAKRLRA